jgi:hypothetical protein
MAGFSPRDAGIAEKHAGLIAALIVLIDSWESHARYLEWRDYDRPGMHRAAALRYCAGRAREALHQAGIDLGDKPPVHPPGSDLDDMDPAGMLLDGSRPTGGRAEPPPRADHQWPSKADLTAASTHADPGPFVVHHDWPDPDVVNAHIMAGIDPDLRAPAPEPLTLNDLGAICESTTSESEPLRELHCARDVAHALCDYLAHNQGFLSANHQIALTGVTPRGGTDIVIDGDMPASQWRLEEDGKIIREGHVGRGLGNWWASE